MSTLFGASAATVAVYLWFLNLASNQRSFAAFVGSELIIFAMMIYVYRKPSLTGATTSWLLLGCVTAAAVLLLAMQLGSQ